MSRVYTRVVWQWQDGVLVEREADWYEYFGPVALAHTVAAVTQSKFRFRSDTAAVDATPTWLAAENTNINVDVSSGDVILRLRFLMQETAGSATGNVNWGIRTSLDAYAADLTTSTSGVRAADAGASGDDTVIGTSRLTGTGSMFDGQYDESGTSSTASTGASTWAELEYGLKVINADVTNAQTIDFRCYPVGTTPTFTAVPRITITKTITAPNEPTGLGATAVSSSQINLTWTAPASGSPPTGYQIDRESPVGGGFSTIVANTATTAVTYSDTGRTPVTQYNYRVWSLNTAGASAIASTAANATTPTADVGIVTSFGFGPPYF